jgi:hypothetical protein
MLIARAVLEAAVRRNRIGSEAARPGRRRWWRAVLATAATIALAAGMAAPAAAQDADVDDETGGAACADADLRLDVRPTDAYGSWIFWS